MLVGLLHTSIAFYRFILTVLSTMLSNMLSSSEGDQTHRHLCEGCGYVVMGAKLSIILLLRLPVLFLSETESVGRFTVLSNVSGLQATTLHSHCFIMYNPMLDLNNFAWNPPREFMVQPLINDQSLHINLFIIQLHNIHHILT